MVKADAKRNYYADLELTPAADTEEVKRQFRKLARLYHPDRNPGKEVEYVPKFQAIQAAHEILSDPEQRAKYDNDRRRMGHGAGGSRPAPPPRQGQTNFGRSPYEAWSNFPPPRMRTNANPQRERPQSYAAPPTSSMPRPPPPPPPPPPPQYSGATPSYARPPPPRPPPRQTYAQDDSDARKNVFTAWEKMNPRRQHPDPTWSDDDGLRKARAANDATRAHESKPGLGRSYTTRNPPGRRPGFDPSARLSGDWEPAARSTSAYQNSPRPSSRPAVPSPPPPTAHGEKPRARPDPLGAFRAKTSADDVPFSEGLRVRTPYGGEGIGQKTYFNPDDLSRSSSMRDVPELGRKAGSKGSPRANAARHRSASPIGRNSTGHSARRASVQPGARAKATFNVGYSDTDEEPASPASDSSMKPMSGEAANAAKARRTAKPGSFWQGRADSPGKETPPQTDGANGPTPTYANLFHSLNALRAQADGQAKPADSSQFSNISLFSTNTTGFNFSPANVPTFDFSPSASKFKKRPTPLQELGQTPLQSNDEARTRSDAARNFPQYTLPPDQLANPARNRFSFSNVEDGNSGQPRSNSAENIQTGFNANGWHGTFQGSNAFSPPPAAPSGRGTRRGSPTRRVPTRKTTRAGASTDNPIDLTGAAYPSGAQTNPIDLTSGPFKLPPPPPGGPPGSAGMPPSSAGSSQGGVPLNEQPPTSSGFKSDEWLKKQTFFFPQPGEARPPSPGKQPPSTVKKGKAPRPRKQSKGENNLKPQIISSDAEGEESEVPMHKTKSAPANMDGDAMDIDSDLPNGTTKSTSPRTTREPRMVPVQPQRPDWRDPTSPTGAIPSVNGTIPPGTVPTAVPNAAVPGPPPPPPGPPPHPASNTKQKRDATLNFDSFRTAAPFASSTNGGLSSLKSDLAGTLPFESQPSSTHPTKPQEPRQLELPLPPKAPTPPLNGTRIPQQVWKDYMNAMAFYMGQYYTFDEAMLQHFNARHLTARKFGTGCIEPAEVGASAMNLLEALSDGAGDGYASYLRGMQEDVRVQKHWDVARERHRDAIEALLDFKKRIATGEVKIMPPGHA